MTAPGFIVPRSERNSSGPTFSPERRYCNIYRGIYKWENMPKDMPEGYVEDCLFYYGSVSAKNIPGLGEYILPANPVTFDTYGNATSWIPTGIVGIPNDSEIMKQSTNPVLSIGNSIYDDIKLYLDIITHSYQSLDQNVIGMSQPIMLLGRGGNSANAETLKLEISNGTKFIPVVDMNRIDAKVIDLGVVDHTQNLIATANAIDNEILSVMGVKNTGTEKSSGVTMEETTSVHQELSLISDTGLDDRLKWCDLINAVNGTNYSVRLSDAYIQEPEIIEEEPDQDNSDGDDDV